MKTAEELPEADADECEVRELRIPALGSLSLWLRNGTPTNDRLLPIAPPKGILPQRNHPYTPAEFIRVLRPVAAVKLVHAQK